MPLQKRFIFLPLLLFIFIGCGKEIFQEKETADWPMVHKNLARTGSYGKSAVPPLQLKWKFQTNGPIYSSPAVVNGIVYIIANDTGNYSRDTQTCFALETKTGKLLWKQKIGRVTYFGDNSPVVSKGIVYAGAGYALNTNTGEVLWHNENLYSEFPAFVMDTVIYYANAGGSWISVDSRTGKILIYYQAT
jgi:outer membrane protein assembly factor BamB